MMIDNIKNKIQDNINCIIKVDKLDGITLECYIPEGEDFDDRENEIRDGINKLKLNPINIEVNKEKRNIFALQFPELEEEISDQDVIKFYKDIFKWILDNYTSNASDKKYIRKAFIIEHKMTFTKDAIRIYYRSYINPYKKALKDFLENFEYRVKINNLFETYVDIYFGGENNNDDIR